MLCPFNTPLLGCIFYAEKSMERYNIISEKNKREIVLLRGSGCVYKKCTFCDYYTDSCKNPQENYLLNQSVLEQVTGQYGNLEVINSGSVFELDEKTLDLIKSICHEKKISTIHFESHYLYRKKIPDLRKYFSEFDLKMKLGLETFDYDFRESVLHKGINEKIHLLLQNTLMKQIFSLESLVKPLKV